VPEDFAAKQALIGVGILPAGPSVPDSADHGQFPGSYVEGWQISNPNAIRAAAGAALRHHSRLASGYPVNDSDWQSPATSATGKRLFFRTFNAAGQPRGTYQHWAKVYAEKVLPSSGRAGVATRARQE